MVILTVFILLLGMQMFGADVRFGRRRIRHNDTLLWALVTVFQVLRGGLERHNVRRHEGWWVLVTPHRAAADNRAVPGAEPLCRHLADNFGEPRLAMKCRAAASGQCRFFQHLVKGGKAELSLAERAERRFWANLPTRR